MERVPLPLHNCAVPAARPQSLGNGLERRANHAAGKSFGVANELLPLILSLHLLATKDPPPS